MYTVYTSRREGKAHSCDNCFTATTSYQPSLAFQHYQPQEGSTACACTGSGLFTGDDRPGTHGTSSRREGHHLPARTDGFLEQLLAAALAAGSLPAHAPRHLAHALTSRLIAASRRCFRTQAKPLQVQYTPSAIATSHSHAKDRLTALNARNQNGQKRR